MCCLAAVTDDRVVGGPGQVVQALISLLSFICRRLGLPRANPLLRGHNDRLAGGPGQVVHALIYYVQAIGAATGESAASLLGTMTGLLVGRALKDKSWRLVPLPSAASIIGNTAVLTWCLAQKPPLLPLSQVSNQDDEKVLR